MGSFSLVRNLLLVGLVILSVSGALAAPSPAVSQHTDLGQLSFQDEQDRSRQLQEWRGTLLVVNLWASWCAACVDEMPSLQRLQQQFDPQTLRVMTLNQDLEQSEAIRALLARYGAEELPAYRDHHSRLGQAVGQTLLPMTLVISPKGELLGELVGPAEWDSDDAVALMHQYLAESL